MGRLAADIQTAFASPSVRHIEPVFAGAGHGIGHDGRLAGSVADIAQRVTTQEVCKPFTPDVRPAVFAFQQGRGQAIEQIIPHRAGASAQTRQSFRAAQHFDLRRNGNPVTIAAHFVGELLGQIVGKGLPIGGLTTGVGMIPKRLIIRWLGQARAVSHQGIHILIAVADQVGLGVGFPPCPCLARHIGRIKQSTCMKAADHADDRPRAISQHVAQTSGHMRLAPVVICGLDLVGWRGCPQRCAVGADVLQKATPIGVTQAGLEQVIPQFEPVATPEPFAKRADIVATVEPLFLNQ